MHRLPAPNFPIHSDTGYYDSHSPLLTYSFTDKNIKVPVVCAHTAEHVRLQMCAHAAEQVLLQMCARTAKRACSCDVHSHC